MRLVSAILFVALTGAGVASSLADEAKPADPKPEVTRKKVPYRVVKMLPETGQVLLFDRNHGNHVVAEVGQTLDGYLVDAIDEDEVTLVADNGAQIILTSPPPPRVAKRTAAKKTEPVDPYADDAGDGAPAVAKAKAEGPVDPYAEPEPPAAAGEGGVRVASAADPSLATAGTTESTESTESAGPAAKKAPPPPPVFVDSAPVPSDPYADPGIAAFADAVGATSAPVEPAPAAPAKPAKKPAKGSSKAAPSNDDAAALASAATGTPAPTATTTAPTATSPTATAAKPAAPGSVTIARSEVDAALADFGKLAGSFKATFTPDGLRFDAVHDGTLLAKVGLRRGDLITYVDGQPLRSLDDAATLYARAGTVKNTTLQIVRDGKLVTVRVSIQ